MNEDGAGEILELLGIARDDFGVERFEQQQMLLQAGRNPALAQRLDEGNEHDEGLGRALSWRNSQSG